MSRRPAPKVPDDDPAFAPVKSWLGWVLTIGGKKAPAVTGLMIGTLVVFAVGLAVLYIGKGIPLHKILLMAAVGLIVGVVAILAAKAVARRKGGQLLGQVVIWCLSAVFMAVIVLVISVVFFGVPRAGVLLVARLLDQPNVGILPPGSTEHVTAAQSALELKHIFREPPAGRDAAERVANLARYPALSIEDTTLSVPAGANLYIAANTLEISNAVIETNGANLTIEVLQLISNNGRVRANTVAVSSQGNGRGGGRLTLIIHDRIDGSPLAVDLSGQAGAPGEPGTPGSPGANGRAGEHSASSLFDCKHGPGDGESGGRGGTGGDGKPGASGGDGGILVLIADVDQSRIDFHADGGAGGRGGAGGAGGPGGQGGASGSADGLCRGGAHAGPPGPQGQAGPNGLNGNSGQAGSMTVRPLAQITAP